MEHTISMDYKRISLRPLKEEEIEDARVLRNNNLSGFMNNREITPEAQKIWFSKYLSLPGEIMFSVFHAKSGRWIGTAALFAIDAQNAQAECGRFIIDKSRTDEKGLGCEAVEAVCKIGFEELCLERLYLSVYEDNIPAVKTYERAGFFEYGVSEDFYGRKLLLMERKKQTEGDIV